MKLVQKRQKDAPSQWDVATRELLAAVPARLRNAVSEVLSNPRLGGRGLRAWLALIAVDERALPPRLAEELIEVYLREEEAEPLYDCEKCGLSIPVRAARRCGHEATIEHVFFSNCPHCGGRTGRFAFWSRTT